MKLKANKDILWPSTSDYLKEMSIFAKFLYYTGCIKRSKFIYSSETGNKKWTSVYIRPEFHACFKVRWYHPFTWILIIMRVFIVGMYHLFDYLYTKLRSSDVYFYTPFSIFVSIERAIEYKPGHLPPPPAEGEQPPTFEVTDEE